MIRLLHQNYKTRDEKGELIDAVQKALGGDTSKKASEEAVKAVLESIAKGIKKDGNVQLIGFGTFEVRKRAARTGRNPKTARPSDRRLQDGLLQALVRAQGQALIATPGAFNPSI